MSLRHCGRALGYVTRHITGSGWTTFTKLNAAIHNGPALAAHDGALHCVHRDRIL
ncbi:hypothetical protein [Streptomyces sp. NPDC051994]|uniref:hypothetical protein n=1 Tax=unclassified Streptomyces TaxID=2593676 RepID=UPI00343C4AF3